MNRRLRELFEQDQVDRAGDRLRPGTSERDHGRRAEVVALLDAGAAAAAEDYYHAAMVPQHGDRRDHYRRAHELARRAAELGHRPGRRLAAAAHDRWLMAAGRPQRYGTQYRTQGDRWSCGRSTRRPPTPSGPPGTCRRWRRRAAARRS